MKKVKLYHIVLFVVVLILVLYYLVPLLFLINYNHDMHDIDVIPVEKAHLKIVYSAVHQYRIDHSGLPSEEGFIDELSGDFEDPNILFGFKYFRQGDEFVLVNTGKNKIFDTPEGFENIRNYKGESDDLILFSPFP